LKNIYNTNYLGSGENPSELGYETGPIAIWPYGGLTTLGLPQDPLPLGLGAGPKRIGSWQRLITIGSWHRQGSPSARSRHVACESGCASLARQIQRHVVLGSNPTQGQAAQASDVPAWRRGLAHAHGKGTQRHVALQSAQRKGRKPRCQVFHVGVRAWLTPRAMQASPSAP
jgi:hypothetical protein